MTTGTMPAAGLAHPWGGLRHAIPALVLGLLAFGFLFQTEISSAVSVWETSTAYGHCLFVLPIALYLAWDRRAAIRGTPVIPMPVFGVLAIPLGIAWLSAERVGLMEGRQLVAVGLLQVLFLAVLGWRMWRALAVPLLYLFFLVPFGAFITPALQGFTARFIIIGLNALGIPNFADNYVIEIPEGTFYVAEACAGLRFLIAAIAFGVLYACLIYRSPAKRAAFIAASIAIPIIANGFRGLGIVTLGHVIGSAEAAAADHIIYGWLFFSLVILVLIAAGLPFREDGIAYEPILDRNPSPRLEASTGRVMLAAVTVILATAAGPAMAALIERAARAAPAAIDPRFAVAAGCSELPSAASTGTAGVQPVIHRFACERTTLVVTVATLPARANPAAVLNAMRQMTGELVAEDTEYGILHVAGTVPPAWQLVETSTPARVTAIALWAEGKRGSTGIAFRLGQAWRSVVGASHDPVVVAVSADPNVDHLSAHGRDALRHTMAEFLAAQPELDAEVAALSAVTAAR